MQSIKKLSNFLISNSARIAALGLLSAFIKNLYIKILHLLFFTFLKIKFLYNFVNYIIRYTLFNNIKILKFEYIYINEYLI